MLYVTTTPVYIPIWTIKDPAQTAMDASTVEVYIPIWTIKDMSVRVGVKSKLARLHSNMDD